MHLLLAWCLCLALTLASSARAAEVEVAVLQGALQPGRAGEVHVAVLVDGVVPANAPTFSAWGGSLSPLRERDVPGVHALALVPDPGATSVSLVTRLGADVVDERRIEVRAPDPSSLSWDVPRASATEGRVTLRLAGADLPPVDALQLVTSEGRIGSVTVVEGGISVVVETEASRQPRMLVVAARDGRRDRLPVWASVPLWGRASVVASTAPGATARVRVGGRLLPAATADGSGRVEIAVTYPPEVGEARLEVTERGGAVTTSPVPLPNVTAPVLTLLSVGPYHPGEPAPEVLVHAVRPSGAEVRGDGPTCAAAGQGALAVTPVGTGTWRVAVPVVLLQRAVEARVACSLDDSMVRTVVSGAEGVPTSLAVRVYQSILDADFPSSDFQVVLEDAFGQRVAPVGHIDASASFGLVKLQPPSGAGVRGTYDGQVALEIGEDTLTVGWRAPAGSGAIQRVEVVGGPITGRTAAVYLRALDRQRRPLPGRVLSISVGAVQRDVVTGADGWAGVTIPSSDPVRPAALAIDAEGRRFAGVAVPGLPTGRGPGQPDLSSSLEIIVDPGRAAEIALEVSPTELEPGPNASARVTARLLDRTGGVTETRPDELTATEGRLEPAGREPDGAYAWTWYAPSGYRGRRVQITARSIATDLEATQTVVVRPAPIRRWIGINAGLQTNFGRIVSPSALLDAGWYLRVGPRERPLADGGSRLVFRTSVGWYGATVKTDVLQGSSATIRMDLIPITAAVELRQVYPAQAYWFDLGIVVAPYVGSDAVDQVVRPPRVGVLPPGLLLAAGYGIRVPGGEVMLELRGTILTSPGSDVSLSGQVGGLSVTVGYRVAY